MLCVGVSIPSPPCRRVGGILPGNTPSWRDTDMTDTAPCYLFLDCDRFYFAVEAAERPGLADDPRPVIIGRDPRVAPRGIVTTANDAARALGIHSGLSAAIALRLAPNALFLPPRHEIYARYSARVMAVLRDESPLVEQHSIDEAACVWPHGFRPEPPLALRAGVWAVPARGQPRHRSQHAQSGTRAEEHLGRAHLPPRHHRPTAALGATAGPGGGGRVAPRAGGPQGRGGRDQAPLRQLADPDAADEAPGGHGRRAGPGGRRRRAHAAELGPHAGRTTDRPQSRAPHGRDQAHAATASL